MEQQTLLLAGHHLRSLVVESGISEEVIEARGYWTCEDPDNLIDLGFSKLQRRTPALVIPVHDVKGAIRFHRIRPDNPRISPQKPDRVVKYEQPAGTPVVLDVPPLAHDGLGNPGRRLWVVEGEKKADSLASQGEVAIALLGVWNWKKDGWMLPEWEEVRLMGREVLICFDSDAVDKYQVRLAEVALAKALEGRMGYVG
jgi:putative DNA primase/helicase